MSYTRTVLIPSGIPGRYQYHSTLTSEVSPRNFYTRELMLQNNMFSCLKEWESASLGGPSWATSPGFPTANYPWLAPSDATLRNRAYGAFVSQLRNRQPQGGLAMTIKTLGQTRKMVYDRLKKMTDVVLGLNRYYQIAPKKWRPVKDESWKKRRSRIRKNMRELDRFDKRKASAFHPALRDDRIRGELRSLGGTLLEGMFGWGPLIADIQQLFQIEDKLPGSQGFISASAKDFYTAHDPGGSSSYYPRTSISVTGNRRLTYSGQYRITNPQLFLANSLGLVNPAALVWDAIPWSWVVGMFVNVSALLSSLTDFVGVEISNFASTSTLKLNGLLLNQQRRVAPGTNVSVGNPPTPVPLQWEYAFKTLNYGVLRKSRGFANAPPNPTLELRVPSPSLGLAAITLGIALQKLT